MRILHLISTLDPAMGGPAEVVRMLVEFGPADIEQEIVCVDPPDAAFLAGFGCPVHALGPWRTGYWYSAKLVPWLRANRSRFDGVFVHALWNYMPRAALRTLPGVTPYVVFVHGMLDPYFKHAFPRKHLKKRVSWLLTERPLLRGARYALFTTAAEDELAGDSFGERPWRPLVVPLGTDAPVPATQGDREAFYALCPAVRGRRFLLYLGRLHPKKGGDLLIAAFARGADACGAGEHVAGEDTEPPLHLVMAGPDAPPFAAQLQSMAQAAGIADRVHWPGMLTGAAKTGAFAACEAFVLPSHQENFGIAVVEALAAGRPVLLADRINIAPEIAADGCGFVEPDTAAGTARLLERWCALTPAQRQAMGAQALRTFAARYDMRRNANAILRVFEPRTT